MSNTSASIATYKQNLRRGLSPRHREAMRRLAMGTPIGKVAEDLGYSVSHLTKISKSPLFLREMERMQTRLDQASYNAMQELRKIHPKAVQAYEDLISQTEYKQLRFNTAKDLFDRTGVVAARYAQSIEAVQSYEQRLAEVKAKYTVTTHEEPSPIKVMGGEHLLEEYDK